MHFLKLFFPQTSTAWAKPCKIARHLGFPSEKKKSHLVPASPIRGSMLAQPHRAGGDTPNPPGASRGQHSPFPHLPILYRAMRQDRGPDKEPNRTHVPREKPSFPPRRSSPLQRRLSTIISLLPRSEFYCLLPPLLIINIDFTACVIIPVWRFIFLFRIAWRTGAL